MGATNTTANYNLSQFISTDKPAWLQDYNGDMLKIDTGINAAKVAADGAQNAASAAQNDATTANNTITNTINPTISSLTTTVGNQGGAINTIQSLIGNGTPTTTDQTIIGAINEINAALTPLTLKDYSSVALNTSTTIFGSTGYYGDLEITDDVALYGIPLSATAEASGLPGLCSIEFRSNNKVFIRTVVSSASATTAVVHVAFGENATHV